MTVFGLVRSAAGNSESARSEYLGPTGKRSAGKLACSVWSGGKAVRPYLSLFDHRFLDLVMLSPQGRRLSFTVGPL